MPNIFKDQDTFMTACGQTTTEFNSSQYHMYKDLIKEEFQELQDAESLSDELDALIDILVVTTGALHSLGADGEGAWNEVMRTNFAKIDPDTGFVRRRADGKILKPDNWQAPALDQFLPK